jgi:hypothetical protein
MMRVRYLESMEYKMLNRIKFVRGSVLLRKDFNDLGSYRQISRGLNKLIGQKKIVKIGAGVYAKAYFSQYTDVPIVKGGVDVVLRDALKRLGVAYEPGTMEMEYNAGRSTQVPVRNIVRLKNRCRRRIGYRNSQLFFEKNINAK